MNKNFAAVYELAYQLWATNTLPGREALAAKYQVSERLAGAVITALRNQDIIAKCSGTPASPGGIPAPLDIKGKSTLTKYIGRDDGVILQWTKTDKSFSARMELMTAAIQEMSKEITPQPEINRRKTTSMQDVLTVYPIADVHLGQLAYKKETGCSSDINIIKGILLSGMTSLVRSAPPSEHCLIANLGDFFHCDNLTGNTSRSGNVLDVDSRWSKMFLTGVYCFRKLIELALAKHSFVKVIGGPGNHDDISALALTVTMQAVFEKNPRVEIKLPINPFAYYEFGKVMICVNHGMVNAQQLAMIAATDQPEMWGRTKYRTALVGHKHSKGLVECPGMIVEQFRAVAAQDAWAHSKYRSGREMIRIDYDREGERGRRIKNIAY